MASLRRLGLIGLLAALSCGGGCSAVPTTTPAPPALPEIPAAQAGGANVIVNSPEKPCCKRSLWTFLGVPGVLKFAGGAGRVGLARLGRRFPGLEPKPPLTPLTDPSNSGPNASPAQQEAAKVKADQDAAAQKAKGIEFLGRIGCLQYYPDTAKALLAALDDPMEEVRFAAAKALRAANGGPCEVCKSNACCSREVIEKLQDIGYMTRDDGCWKEPSARVRRMARLAVKGCGCVPVAVDGSGLPEEGPMEDPLPADTEAPGGAEPPVEEISAADAVDAGTGVRQASAASPLGAGARPPAEALAQTVLATVNGLAITAEEVPGAVAWLQRRPGGVADRSRPPAAVEAELQRAIDRVLLRQAVLRERNAPPETPLGEDEVNRWVGEQAVADVAPAEIQAYYEQHADDLKSSAYARWEVLTFAAKENWDVEKARAGMLALRARMSGETEESVPVNLADLRARVVDWTALDDLESESLGRMLAVLPVEEVSPVWEDEAGLHLYRVLERRPARMTPLTEAAEAIRGELLRRRRQAARDQLLQALRAEATIMQGDWASPAGDADSAAAVPASPPRPSPPRTRSEFLRPPAPAQRLP